MHFKNDMLARMGILLFKTPCLQWRRNCTKKGTLQIQYEIVADVLCY